MRYISLFSGIEAASVAWESLGWEPVAFSEIEPFPCELLKQRFPLVPNLGDITKTDWREYAGTVDLVVGGSPCQSFSIAGNREGLAGESGLMFEYIRAVHEIRPRYFIWENVPGALSSECGKAFEQLLTEMDDLGYGLAWRVLDSQFYGVAQRRRRIFLVGCLGDPECAAEILFERESMRWDYPSSRDKRKSLAEHVKSCIRSCYTMLVRCGCAGGGKGALIQEDVSATLSTSNVQTIFQPIEPECYCLQGNMIGRGDKNGPQGDGINEDVAYTLNTTDRHAVVYLPFDKTQVTSKQNGSNPQWGDPCHTISSECKPPHVVCMSKVGGDPSFVAIEASNGEDVVGALCARDYKGVGSQYVSEGKVIAQQSKSSYVVRKLMPIECERLQGFPDGWTDIEFKGKPVSDAARYKALGNSMAVPVMRWIGERIQLIESLKEQ